MDNRHFNPDRPGNPFDYDDGKPFDGGQSRVEHTEAARKKLRETEEEELGRIPDWVPFPIDVLPASVRKYVLASAAAMDCDPAFVAHPALGVLSAAVGNSVRVKIKKSWIESCAGIFATIAGSGSGKTPAEYKALHPVYALEREAREAHRTEKSRYEIELDQYEEAATKKRTEKPRKPVMQRFRVGDITIETLMVIHRDNPRGLLLLRGEFAGWLGSFDRYTRGESDLQSWIEIHDGKPITRDRKSDGEERGAVYLEYPFVCVIGGIQPQILCARLKDVHYSSGFVARVLWILPPFHIPRWTEADVFDDVLAGYERTVRRLYGEPFVDAPDVLSFTPEAKSLFIGFADETTHLLQQRPGALFASMIVKMKPVAARLALVLHLAEHAEAGTKAGPIDAAAMEGAVRLASWYRSEAGRIYRLLGLDQKCLSVDERKVRNLPDPFTSDDVKVEWDVKKRQAYRIIIRLEASGLIRKEKQGTYRYDTFDTFDTFPLDTAKKAENQCHLPGHFDDTSTSIEPLFEKSALKVSSEMTQKNGQDTPVKAQSVMNVISVTTGEKTRPVPDPKETGNRESSYSGGEKVSTPLGIGTVVEAPEPPYEHKVPVRFEHLADTRLFPIDQLTLLLRNGEPPAAHKRIERETQAAPERTGRERTNTP